MGKGGWIGLLLAVGMLAAAVLFLLSEAKEGAGSEPAPSASPSPGSSPPASPGTVTATAAARPALPAPAAGAPAPTAADSEPTVDPRTGDVRTIKTTPEGKTYVEIVHPDGSRKRDFRRSAVRSLRYHHRLAGGPRLLEARNAVGLKRETRPAVWTCIRDHWGALVALPGVDPNPSVAVFAHTRASDDQVTITSVEVEVDADAQDPEVTRCIEEALNGMSASLDPASDQKPYEDFEVGMRFRLPPSQAPGGRAPAP